MEYLGYAVVGLPFLFAVVMGLFIPLLILTLYRNAGAGIALTSLLCAFEIFYPNLEGPQIGVRLYVPDIVTALIGVTALFRFMLQSAARPRFFAWYMFLLAIFVSMGLGFGTLGSLAGVAARPYFYAIAVGTYALTFPANAKMVRQLFNAMACLSVVIMLTIFARWVITFVPISELLPETGQFSSSEASLLRVVSSEKAALLAQIFVASLFYPQVSGGLRALRTVLPVIFVTVIALQHRSVWLAMISGLASRFALPQAGRKASGQLIVIVAIVVVIVLPLSLSGKFGGASEDIARSADRAVAMSDTADARLGSWKFMLQKWADGGPRALVVGLPMGTSAERALLTSGHTYTRVNFQAHNYYVQTVFNTGLLGIAASLLVYGWIFSVLYRNVGDNELGWAAGAMLLVTVAQSIYYVFYGIDYMQGLILGVAGALAVTLRSNSQTVAGHASLQTRLAAARIIAAAQRPR